MRTSHTFRPQGLFPITLTRLSLDDVAVLRPFLQRVEIPERPGFWSFGRPPLLLPRTLVGLERMFGPAHKGDRLEHIFYYNLLFRAKRDGQHLRYVLHVQDHKSYVVTAARV